MRPSNIPVLLSAALLAAGLIGTTGCGGDTQSVDIKMRSESEAAAAARKQHELETKAKAEAEAKAKADAEAKAAADQAKAAASPIGQITAVRAKEGLPTYLFIALQGQPPAIGASLRVTRNGRALATVVVETVTGSNLAARVTIWAAGVQTLLVGDTVEAP